MEPTHRRTLGAVLAADGLCTFRVWNPLATAVDVVLLADAPQVVPLEPQANGYFAASVANVAAGTHYLYRFNAKERPDPASQSQPDGVHGASQVVSPAFDWTDHHWAGVVLHDYIIYELHVGTFTAAGTFEAIIPLLDDLVQLGITAIELMPVAQFPGTRNWGYDGASAFAVHDSYGGVIGLKRLVNACHERGLAVILDVVYNHLGAEGNYLWDYAPYFTTKYTTPWGAAVNLDGADSDHVRQYFIENALMWLDEFHIDALRLDATHAFFDQSAYPFLQQLSDAIHVLGEQQHRRMYVIAESDQNNPRLLRSPDLGGYGVDAQWSDDFHHALHTLLTAESDGYYADYMLTDQRTTVLPLVKALREGFVYSGEYSRYRRHCHGASSAGLAADRLVVCIQNHDQIGNRMQGDRLSATLPFDQLKQAAGMVLTAPNLPLLFMGEEYGETAPFLYFISHGDPDLVEAVRQGRQTEFAAFGWEHAPPDPFAVETFERSRLDHTLREHGEHRELWQWYQSLMTLRKTHPALRDSIHREVLGYEQECVVLLRRWSGEHQLAIIACFNADPVRVAVQLPDGEWQRLMHNTQVPELIDSHGTVQLRLPAHAFAIYERVR